MNIDRNVDFYSRTQLQPDDKWRQERGNKGINTGHDNGIGDIRFGQLGDQITLLEVPPGQAPTRTTPVIRAESFIKIRHSK